MNSIQAIWCIVLLQVSLCFAQVPFREKDSWYLVDTENMKRLTKETYVDMQILGNYFVATTPELNKVILNQKGEILLQSKHLDYKMIGQNHIAFLMNKAHENKSTWGLMTSDLKPVYDAKFDDIQWSTEQYFFAKSQGRWGVIYPDGEWFEQPEYQSFYPFGIGYPQIIKIHEHKLVYQKSFFTFTIKNLITKKEIDIEYNEMMVPKFEKNFIIFYHKLGMSKVYDYDGNVVLPLGVAEFRPTDGNFIAGSNVGIRKTYIYSNHKTKIAELQGRLITGFEDGYALLENFPYYNVFDSTGQITYKSLHQLKRVSGKFFLGCDDNFDPLLINGATGESFELPNTGEILEFNERLNQIVFVANGRSNQSNLCVFDYVEQIYRLYDNYLSVKLDQGDFYKIQYAPSKYVYMNGQTGQRYFDFLPKYTAVKNTKGKFEIIEKQSKINIFHRSFHEINQFGINDSIFVGRDSTKFYLINAAQKTVSQAFDRVEKQPNGFIVRSNKKSGFYDFNLNAVVPLIYGNVSLLTSKNQNYRNTYFFHVKGDSRNSNGLLDKNGKMVYDTIYSHIYVHHDDAIVARSDKGKRPELYSFVDWNGQKLPKLQNCVGANLIDSALYWVRNENTPDILYHVQSNEWFEVPKKIKDINKFSSKDGQHYFFFMKDKKVGIMDSKGQILHNPDQFTTHNLPGSPILYMTSKKRSVLIEIQSNKLTFKPIESIEFLNYDNSEIINPTSWRFTQKKGEFKILVDGYLNPIGNMEYKDIWEGEFFTLAKNKDGKIGAIDVMTGAVIIPFDYDKSECPYYKPYEFFLKGKELHVYDYYGNRVFQNIQIEEVIGNNLYEDLAEECEILFIRNQQGKHIIDIKSEEIILSNIQKVFWDEDLYYAQKLDSDEYGKFVPIKLESGVGIYSFSDNIFILKPEFEWISIELNQETSGLFVITKNGRGLNFFDLKTQNFLLEKEAKEIISTMISRDLYTVLIDQKLFVLYWPVDSAFFEVIPTNLPKNKYALYFDQELLYSKEDSSLVMSGFIVRLGKKSGFLLRNGKIVVPIEFDFVDNLIYNKQFILAMKNKKTYILNLEGKYFCQQGFDTIDFVHQDGIVAYASDKNMAYVIYSDGSVKVKNE